MNNTDGLYVALLALLVLCSNLVTAMVIRPARDSDLEAVLELDYKVSFEFFKPLFVTGYPDTYGKNVDEFLQLELSEDVKMFPEYIKNTDKQGLFIAEDIVQHKPVGLITFTKEYDGNVVIDLLMVDQAYRGTGIGKQLVLAARDRFAGIRSMSVYPLRFANEATLKFYKKFGSLK